jgi:hypothetical protein
LLTFRLTLLEQLNTNAFALWAATAAAGGASQAEAGLVQFVRQGPWSAVRFFMIPFCVASYSGMINQEDKLDTFVYLFPTAGRDGEQLLSGAPDSLVFVAVNACLTIAARCARRLVAPPPEPASSAVSVVLPPGAALCDRLCFPASDG